MTDQEKNLNTGEQPTPDTQPEPAVEAEPVVEPAAEAAAEAEPVAEVAAEAAAEAEPVAEVVAEVEAEPVAEVAAEAEPVAEAAAAPIAEAVKPAAAKTPRELRAEHESTEAAAPALAISLPRLKTGDLLPRSSGMNQTELFGRTLPLNIYDVVFISLGVFTLLEVAVSEIFPHGAVTIVLLLALTLVKTFHVVWYYMHLNHDSRIFWLSLLVPAFIALIGLLYLAAIPSTGY
jgi:caa(3)-type oxidase subunit IV